MLCYVRKLLRTNPAKYSYLDLSAPREKKNLVCIKFDTCQILYKPKNFLPERGKA